MNRGAVAEINLSAIADNFKIVKKCVKDKAVIAVVKADAYGHGAVEVSKRLIKEGASYLAVAYIGEAIELRRVDITAPIIVLFNGTDIEGLFDFNLIPVIHDINTAVAISRVAQQRKTSIKVHVKTDTGMGRLGLSSDHAVEEILKISRMEGIVLSGVMSHFSDADLSDKSYAILQLERFNRIREMVSKRLKRKIMWHIANSAAVLTFEDAHLDAVRPGLMLYGYSPIVDSKEKLIPAMKVKTKVLCIRNLPPGSPVSYGRTFVTKRHSRIGALPIGYANGYSRVFSNNAEVLIRGKRAPVVGRICMDLTMVDLTDINDSKEGDEVVILGSQEGESITAHELAHKANTIPYEILTLLGSHSRKEYVDAQTD